jgi:hypothetical protein
MQTLYVVLAFLMMVILPLLVASRRGDRQEELHSFGSKDS